MEEATKSPLRTAILTVGYRSKELAEQLKDEPYFLCDENCVGESGALFAKQPRVWMHVAKRITLDNSNPTNFQQACAGLLRLVCEGYDVIQVDLDGVFLQRTALFVILQALFLPFVIRQDLYKLQHVVEIRVPNYHTTMPFELCWKN